MVLSSITEISLKLFFSTPTLHHGMEPEAFLHDVHNINAHEILKPDGALARLPGRKVIHTNGIREHAERILITLGIAHHFERNNGAGTGTVDVIGEAFITQ